MKTTLHGHTGSVLALEIAHEKEWLFSSSGTSDHVCVEYSNLDASQATVPSEYGQRAILLLCTSLHQTLTHHRVTYFPLYFLLLFRLSILDAKTPVFNGMTFPRPVIVVHCDESPAWTQVLWTSTSPTLALG